MTRINNDYNNKRKRGKCAGYNEMALHECVQRTLMALLVCVHHDGEQQLCDQEGAQHHGHEEGGARQAHRAPARIHVGSPPFQREHHLRAGLRWGGGGGVRED